MDRVLQADLPLLGRSLRAVASPVGSTRNLTWNPGNVPVVLAPGGPAWCFPCWAEVLEQVSPAGSTWNLTWNPLSVPRALAPGGSGRRSSQREGYNEKMKNVTFMVGTGYMGKSICITYQKLKMNIWIYVFVYSLCFEYVFDVFVRCVEDMCFFCACACACACACTCACACACACACVVCVCVCVLTCTVCVKICLQNLYFGIYLGQNDSLSQKSYYVASYIHQPPQRA